MSEIRFFFAVVGMMCVPCGASAETYSWGLPGSFRMTFDSGSRGCAIDVARRDVSTDKTTKAFLRGHEVLERENNMPPMAGQGTEDNVTRSRRQVILRNTYGTERHIDTLQDQLQQELNSCLVLKGYIRFYLSEEQKKRLSKLKVGSESRKKYLYELGSDRHIVMSQKSNEN